MISIDIGSINLGYAILNNNGKLEFGLYKLSDRGSGLKNNSSLVISRINKLYDLLAPIVKEKNIETLIVEKQVFRNNIATSLMYSIIGMIRGLGVKKIIIFNPKNKFTKLRISYCTKNKLHKKLSISIAEILLNWKYPETINEFTKYKKRDDISDALLQLFIESSTEDERIELRNKFINQTIT